MPLRPRRILSPYDDDHGACEPWSRCASPPSPPPPPPDTHPPTPSPSPSRSPSPSPSPTPPSPTPACAPAPSPVRQPAAGRRNQGGGARSHGPARDAAAGAHHRAFVTNVLAASAALVFLSLILLGVSVAVRRRNLRRRRRRALLAPEPALAANDGNDDPEGGGGGGAGVVHHVWYIRTVGLDEAAIESIAATRYRAGAGLLGAADCSVCLGEFSDGELLRLLPKCGHAFHVPCIDTWLRAHVNCPLCRSEVIDPAAETGPNAPADPDANANAAAEQLAAASDNHPAPEHEHEEGDDQEAPPAGEDQQPGSPEPLPLPLPCPLPWNVRRAASMDAAMASTAAGVAALDRLPESPPEGEQSDDREKDRAGTDGHPSTQRPAPGGGPPRFFFSRHCRARSSVLPL